MTPLTGNPYGMSVAGVGDVNGDGIGDLAGLQGDTGLGEDDPLSVVVTFGRRDRATVDARAPGANGFVIDRPADQVPDDIEGGRSATEVGMSVAGAGDANGDGLADVIVGAAALGNSLRRRSGSAFVVFGKRDPAPAHLDALGDGGFRIDGPRGGSSVGGRVAGLGDVDGDALSDVAVSSDGAAWVVFGQRAGGVVDLRDPRGRAYAVTGPPPERGELDAYEVAAAGDANGDGRGDVLVAADGNGSDEVPLAVVFGKADARPVDLTRLGADGYAIRGTRIPGLDVGVGEPAGDVDGDGRGDVLLTRGRTAWVVSGRRDAGVVDVRRAGAGVLTIDGVGRNDDADPGAISAGDVNRDGLADVAFTRDLTLPYCFLHPVSLTVVYGRRSGGRVDVRRLGRGGFRLIAPGGIGSPVVGAGDVTGDGRPDLVADQTTRRTRSLAVFTPAPNRRPEPRIRCRPRPI